MRAASSLGVWHPVSWLRAHPRAADAALAVLVTVLSVVFHWVGDRDTLPGFTREPSWWGSLLVVGATAPVAWRRTAPVAAAYVAVAFQVLCEVLDTAGAGWVGVLIAIYSLGAHGTGRARNVALGAIVVAITSILVAGVLLDEIGVDAVVSTVVVATAAFVLGDNLQKRRQHVVNLAERAERAERERELLARERVGEERTRIARELHDVVAHSVSVMVIQAGAARRQLHLDPDRAAQALETIEQTGRHAMDELRRVLGVLRQDAGGAMREPQPGLDAISTLATSDPELHVVLCVDPALNQVPQSVGLNAYRVVQESLTNVRRHAGAVTEVRIDVRKEHGDLVVEIVDDGRGAAADQPRDPGFGLIGMRERVASLGGWLEAGPRRGGGWRVRASLPLGMR